MVIGQTFVLFICAVAVRCTEQRGFLIIAPSTFLEETAEHVCVSLHNTSIPVTVNLAFYSVDFHQKIVSVSHNVTNSNASCMEVYLPPVNLGMARFVATVTSDSDPEISGSIEEMVTVQRKTLVTIIVTDKPVYKPGQEVKFRVLVLTHLLKPQAHVWKVWVEDPSSTRMLQWDNLYTQHGLLELKFPLADNSFQGTWKIYVQQNHSAAESKQFKVVEYVTPKFEVVVLPPSRISADTKLVTWEICAKYSYGQVVHGRLFVQVKLMNQSKLIPPEINDSLQLNDDTGCFNYSLTSTDLNLSDIEAQPDTIVFTATVEEEGTSISQNSTVSSRLVHTEFFLQFQCSSYFKPGLPYKGKVKLMTEDDEDVGAGKKIQICVKVLRKGSAAMNSQGCWSYTSDLGSQVVFTLPFLPKPQEVQMIMLIASAPDYPTKQYLNSSQILMIGPTASQTVRPWFSPSNSYIDASTRSPIHCSSTHMIPVRYTVSNKSEPTPLFYYLIKSRGDLLVLHSMFPKIETLLQSNNVEDEDTVLVRSWRLPLLITPQMAPNSKLTVYYVRSDGEVVATTTPLIVEPCFPNKVRAHWSTVQTSPGSAVTMRIRAHPQSLCAVSVVDQSLYFNTPETPSIDQDLWSYLQAFDYPLETKNSRRTCNVKRSTNEDSAQNGYLRIKRFLLHQDRSYYADTIFAFDELGVVVMSNLVLETRPCEVPKKFRTHVEGAARCLKCSEADNSEPYSTYLVRQNTVKRKKVIRNFFPETWIWDMVFTGNRGEVTINAQTPDSITSWKSSVLCVSDREGFGLASAPPLVTLLPFFIQLDVPYSLKRNEQVQIKLSIYNYMHYDLPVHLDISSDNGLLILDKTTISTCVRVKALGVHIINVKATQLGKFNLTAAATVVSETEGCGPLGITSTKDYVVKTVLVKPEGFSTTQIQSAFICPSEEGGSSSIAWRLSLPNNIVPDSLRVDVSVVADLLGPALQNLDSLVELPTGCGEQNMVGLASNIYILRYIDSLALNEPDLRNKALSNIHKGYQRQMNFKHSYGGFSAFGNKDPTPSMWLTAFVVRTLEDARDLTFIDENIIKDSLNWMIKTQLENGCFPSIGQVFHGSIQGESSEDGMTVALTSMVMLALSALRFPTSPAVVDNAKFCLTAGIASDDVYSLSLSTLVLAKLNFTDKARAALQRLIALSERDEYFLYWQKPGESLALSIETTSYAVLSLLAVGGDSNLIQARKAVKWLLKHRNSKGGFMSSLDTVVALEALSKYALTLPSTQNTNLSVLVTAGQNETSFKVNSANKLLLQTYTLPTIPSKLEAQVKGEGCVILQYMAQYHVESRSGSEIFDLDVSTSPASPVDACSLQKLHICIRYKLTNQTSNMAVLSILFVSGYKPYKISTEDSNDDVETFGGVKKWDEEDDQIVFYLNKVTAQLNCIDVMMERLLVVEDPLPATITLTDYYHPERTITKMYNLQCSENPFAEVVPLNFQDSSIMNDDSFSNFHNVDHELATPAGVEGPVPAYALPPSKSNSSKS